MKKEPKASSTLTRRSFLTGAAAAGALAAAGLATGCAPQAKGETAGTEPQAASPAAPASADAWLGEEPQITDADCAETIDTEVLVVGAGTAGYFAAASAAESGAKVLLIEKSASGNSVRSSALGAVGSRQQQEKGVDIDVAAIVNDMDHYALGQIDARLVRLWAENSGEAVDWYTDLLAESGMEVQLEWNMPEGTYYKEWATGHGTNGEYPSREQDVAKVIDAYITSFDGCEERFETTMQSLIVEDGRVVGVYAQAGDESYLRINASKGVVVATGGYAYNQDMYAALQPTRLSCLGTFDAFPSCTGDGIKALLRIGARMDAVHTSLTFNRCLLAADQKVGDPYQVGADYGYYFFSSQPFLRVDPAGARFHNESAPYDFVMNASSKRPEGQRYWHQIWDANWKNDIYRLHTTGCSTICYREGADHDAWPEMVDEWIAPEMEQFVEAGYIQKADTLDELADKLGFEGAAKETFLATCERQNENFDAQVDPDFGKEPFRLTELRTPPFYGTTKSCGLTLCTLDGIQVNESLQPYGEDGAPIEGVYVVGNDQGGFYAGTYPNLAAGINAGRCATFGRMVGKALAAK